MNVLILNGSPRQNGNTKKMINIFKEEAENNGHIVNVIDVCQKNIKGCMACEYCHSRGNGKCIQKDDMQEVYELMENSEMLIIAAPIYYHNISGQMKCVIDRFYSILYPRNRTKIKKIAMFLSSGSPKQYDGAEFSYEGDFTGYLGLEDMGIYTNYDNQVINKIKDLARKI